MYVKTVVSRILYDGSSFSCGFLLISPQHEKCHHAGGANGRVSFKSEFVSNYIAYAKSKCSNQKAETDNLGTKTIMLFEENNSYLRIYKDTDKLIIKKWENFMLC